MTRRRWIYRGSEVIEVTADYVPPNEARNTIVGDSHYDGLRSPIDGADISTRSKHRDYMKRHDLTTVDDFKDTWADAAKQRERAMQGEDPTRVRDIVRAVEKVQQGYRPRRVYNED